MDATNRIDYIEMPARNLAGTKAFFTRLFGFEFTDYGPEYASFHDGRLAGGFYAAESSASVANGSVLVVFYAAHLEETLERVRSLTSELGGTVTRDIYSFPGGRRFHFEDPSGNEFAVWSE